MNASGSARRRGQPLVALAVLMGGWVAARALVPTDGWLDVPLPPNVTKRAGTPDRMPLRAQAEPTPADPVLAESPFAAPLALEPEQAPVLASIGTPRSVGVKSPIPRAAKPEPQRIAPSVSPEPSQAQPPSPPPPAAVPFAAAPPGHGRWSLDSWVLWREDGDAAALSTPSYGASQAGAVLRYRLAPGSAREPRAHLRATSALHGEQAELAAGVGVRPIASLPVELLAEGRVGRFSGDTRVRPAAMAVLGPRPQALPGGLTGEAYAQAGYVGGKGATAFADGQVRVTRSFDLGDIKVQAGAGSWGGAQEGAARLDAGPTVSATAPVGEGIFMRFSLDWREKVAGDAEPGSGPVVTLSAGF